MSHKTNNIIQLINVGLKCWYKSSEGKLASSINASKIAMVLSVLNILFII